MGFFFSLGLSALAMCAPSEKFLNMGGPLAIGLGVVFVSSLGRCYNPKNMNCISIYAAITCMYRGTC